MLRIKKILIDNATVCYYPYTLKSITPVEVLVRGFFIMFVHVCVRESVCSAETFVRSIITFKTWIFFKADMYD